MIMISLPPHHPTFSLFLYSLKFMSKISRNQNKREGQNKQTEGKQTNKQTVRQNKSEERPQEYYSACLCCSSPAGHGAFPGMC